jgi:hypothetical protein
MSISKYFACLLLAVCVVGLHKGYSQDNDIPKELYSSAGIPDSLKEGANSVLRYSSEVLTIIGPGKAVDKYHTLVTILNEKGDDEAVMQLPYNRKFNTFSDIVMRVFDANGVLIKKYHKSDMYDAAAINNEILLSDDRFLEVQHVVANYPETIEIEYEKNMTSFLDLDEWDIQEPEQSIQYETYKIIAKPDIGLRYKPVNTSLNPQKSIENGFETYTWTVINKKAWALEDGAMAWRISPNVKLAVDKFNFYGYPGSFNSWQNFGKWQQSLNSDVCSLSPERAAEIKKMTDNLKTDKEKAKFLYEYMQQDMRYVAIFLGVGGLKPFPASFVDQKKYGDCKAFSNYMCALLKAVDIPAYYAIVKSGANQEPMDPSFPFDISDHIIVCIPFKGDTTWLECTESKQPFGLLGAFTENRNALLITEDGGKLANTPKSRPEENQFNSEVHLALDSDGGAKVQVKIFTTGDYRSLYISLPQIKQDKQKEYLMQALNIKQPSVFELLPGADKDGVNELDINMEYDKFCDIATGEKLFYHPHVFDLWGSTLPILNERKSDYYFEFPVQRTCITTINLPANFVVETLPSNQNLKFTYGNYEVKYVYDAVKNQVIGTATFNLTNQVIPAAKYTEMQLYMDAIAKAQNKKLVIRRKA